MRTLTLIAVILFAILAIAHQQSAYAATNFCKGCEPPCVCEGSNFKTCQCPSPGSSCGGLCQNSPCGGDCYCDHPPEGPLFCTGEGEAKAKLATGKYNITYNHFGKGKAIYPIGHEHRVNGLNLAVKKNEAAAAPIAKKSDVICFVFCTQAPCDTADGCACHHNGSGGIICEGKEETKAKLATGKYNITYNHFGTGVAIYPIGMEHLVNGVNWNKKNELPPVNNKKEQKP